MSDWKENAIAWRDLFIEVTMAHGIPHDSAVVRAEAAFRRLAGADDE